MVPVGHEKKVLGRDAGKPPRDQRELEQKGKRAEDTAQGRPSEAAPTGPRAAEKTVGPADGGHGPVATELVRGCGSRASGTAPCSGC